MTNQIKVNRKKFCGLLAYSAETEKTAENRLVQKNHPIYKMKMETPEMMLSKSMSRI